MQLIKCIVCGRNFFENNFTTIISPLKIKVNDKCTLTLHRGAHICSNCKNDYLYKNKRGK